LEEGGALKVERGLSLKSIVKKDNNESRENIFGGG
jgi:hypothetical protein